MAQDVSVTLPSAIVYVTGTVNGTSVTFALSGANTWAASCSKSDDGVYVIAIEACDAAGNVTHYNITLYYGLQLITDRTGGKYNASDLNRVGAAMKHVGDRLSSYGYAADIAPKLDYAMEDEPTQEQIARYVADVATLRAALAVFSTTPEAPPDMDFFHFTKANNLEKILRDVDILLTNMAAEFRYSGEVYAGEV